MVDGGCLSLTTLQYNVSEEDFFANIKQFIVFSTKRNLKRLRQPVDKTEWLSAPTQVNAYYNPPYNQFGKQN